MCVCAYKFCTHSDFGICRICLYHIYSVISQQGQNSRKDYFGSSKAGLSIRDFGYNKQSSFKRIVSKTSYPVLLPVMK